MRRVLVLVVVAMVVVGAVGCSDPTDAALLADTEDALLEQAAVSAPSQLAELFQDLQGSAVGPGGGLYVTAPLSGEIWRVDPSTGATTLFASGLPARDPDLFHIGSGVVDVAFYGSTAYALVTSVGVQWGAEDYVKGIYRIDSPTTYTVIADIGTWADANKPADGIFVDTGFQYAMEAFRGGFLVTDGHHNKVLWVSRDGDVTELIAFNNVVPTGLTTKGNSIYVAQAGPVPHEPEDGKVVMFDHGSSAATEVAAGAPLLVDVEFGRGRALFALAQGDWDTSGFEGLPSLPDVGSLVRVNGNGGFTVLASGLDRPTSFEIIGNSAYVVSLDGEIWRVDGLAGPSFGAH